MKKLARPTGLTRIAPGRFSGLRPALALLVRPKRYRVLSNAALRAAKFEFARLQNRKAPNGAFQMFARPTGFEPVTPAFGGHTCNQ